MAQLATLGSIQVMPCDALTELVQQQAEVPEELHLLMLHLLRLHLLMLQGRMQMRSVTRHEELD